jgi:plasmid maintenance system antidote protein VapI
MTSESTEWRGPLTPWEVTRRRFFESQAPDAAGFARRHNLDEAQVKQVFSGAVDTILPDIIPALSRETQMSEQFFINLNDQYNAGTQAR